MAHMSCKKDCCMFIVPKVIVGKLLYLHLKERKAEIVH